MKILFVNGNLTNGGAQRVISVVASKLAERGNEVSLLLFNRSETEYPLHPDVRLTALRPDYDTYDKTFNLVILKEIRAYLKENKPDVAIGFMQGGYALYLASVGMDFPKIASARINPLRILNRKGFRGAIEKFWFCHADAVVLQTQSQKMLIPDGVWKNCTVIGNPISDQVLPVRPRNYGTQVKTIVMAGRLTDQKNYRMALRAMSLVKEKCPELVLNIFGKGGCQEALEEEIQRLGLQKQVYLRGWTQDILAEYESAQLYLMTSNFEGMPNALMEAMAMGLPCISTDCPTGPSDLIRDGENGYLVPMDDAQALAEAVLKIVNMDDDRRKTMGQNARETILEQYESNIIAQKWEQLCEECRR